MLQQKPQHARGENVGLAGTRRCRQPDRFVGRNGEHLVALKLLRSAAHASSRSASVRFGNHSSRRIS